MKLTCLEPRLAAIRKRILGCSVASLDVSGLEDFQDKKYKTSLEGWQPKADGVYLERRNFSILLILLILGILIQTKGAHAGFDISPQQLILKVNMGERVGWIELNHTGGSPVAVELNVYERDLDLDGTVITKDMRKSDDFNIYPSQILLYPGNRIKSQLILKGKEKVSADKAYILYSREIPFNFPEDKKENVVMGMKITTAYQTIVALETDKRGSLDFVSSKALDSGRVEVIVENKSGGKVPVEHLYIKAGKEKITEFTGKGNSIMPGQKRRFTFKYKKPLTEKEFGFGVK